MADTETQRLLQQLIDVQRQCLAAASVLSNADLDKQVKLGSRDIQARAILYQLLVHPREHFVHLQKVLQETGAPGAHPTEAQLIAAEAAQSLGTLLGLFVRMDDGDLDREHEGHTPRKVLEHLIGAHTRYLKGIQEAAGAE